MMRQNRVQGFWDSRFQTSKDSSGVKASAFYKILTDELLYASAALPMVFDLCFFQPFQILQTLHTLRLVDSLWNMT